MILINKYPISKINNIYYINLLFFIIIILYAADLKA
jgi:hypothetical protein